MIGLAEIADALGLLKPDPPSCEVGGCDRDPNPVVIRGLPMLLCHDHHIEVLLAIEDTEGSA